MSQFHVGQRVRIVTPGYAENDGKEGVILAAWPVPGNGRIPDGRSGVSWRVHVEGDACDFLRYFNDELRAITDPKAEAFLTTVKSWGPLPTKTLEEQLQESILMVRGGSH